MMTKSRVVLVRGEGVLAMKDNPRAAGLREMFRRGLTGLGIGGTLPEAARRLFSPSDRIGIKINTIGGRKISTRPETALALSSILDEGGLPLTNITIWDRTNAELKEAGFILNLGRNGPVVCGTDSQGLGYEGELRAHLNIGSRYSSILTRRITGSISLAILKDHGLAGVTAGLKNYFGAIHNPNKYHDTGCNPFVAEVFDSPPVKSRHRLTVLDALTVQFHRGPAYHPRWARSLETLVFGLDPVAVDSVGRRIIETLRASGGLPTLAEEEREPVYLDTARDMGLGRSDPTEIEIVELSI